MTDHIEMLRRLIKCASGRADFTVSDAREADELLAALSAREGGEALALLERIRDDQSWRTNDNSLWSDILATIAKLRAALPQPQPERVYACDYCGCDYTDAKYCCQRRREYLNAHGQHEPPPPSDADDLAGQIADIAWDFLVAAGYTNEDFDAVPLTIIRDNLSQRKGEKAPPSDAAQGVQAVRVDELIEVAKAAAMKIQHNKETWFPMTDRRLKAALIAVLAAHKGEGNG
jgi:hypothetical protein